MERMRTWRSWLLKKALGGGAGLSWDSVMEHEAEENSWFVASASDWEERRGRKKVLYKASKCAT